MGIFVCDQCGVIENTALSGYWLHRFNSRGKARDLCSQCNPEIGQWHGIFPRKKWDGKERVLNRSAEGE